MVDPPYDPWSHAHSLNVPVHTVRLPDGFRAVTDGRSVWLDDRLTRTEARCALAHELVHIEQGHHGPQPAAVEHQVRGAAARRLVQWGAILRYLGSQCTPHHAADDLGVTEETLRDRLHHATPNELHTLHQVRTNQWV